MTGPASWELRRPEQRPRVTLDPEHVYFVRSATKTSVAAARKLRDLQGELEEAQREGMPDAEQEATFEDRAMDAAVNYLATRLAPMNGSPPAGEALRSMLADDRLGYDDLEALADWVGERAAGGAEIAPPPAAP